MMWYINLLKSSHLRTYNNQNNFVLIRRIIMSRFLTTNQNENDNDNNDNKNNNKDEYNEILENYQIPGRYLHYFKKSTRQLKKEFHLGDEVTTRITAKKLRSEHSTIIENTTNIINTESKNNDNNNDDNNSDNYNNDNNSLSLPLKKDYSNSQKNIYQRLSRAIIRCNDYVPHNHLTSTFVRIINIDVSPELNTVRIWWKPDPQKGVDESKIENTMNKYSIRYRNILQRAMHMKNPPKIIFLRYDKSFYNINELLNKIEEELKIKEN